jgi:hypothetical protein
MPSEILNKLYKISQSTASYVYPLSNDKEKAFIEHILFVISNPSHLEGRTFAQTQFLEYLYGMVPASKRDRIESSKNRVSNEKYYSSRYKAIYEVVNKQGSFGPTIIGRNFTGWLNRNYSDKFGEIIAEAIGN